MSAPSPILKTLDLIPYCLRALGEWQSLDIYQPRLVNVELESSVLQPPGYCRIVKEHGPQFPDVLVWNEKAVKLTVVELLENSKDQEEGYQYKIQNLGLFCKRGKEDKWMESIPMYNNLLMDSMRGEEKADFYWILRLRHRSAEIVSGILDSIPFLKDKGYQYWVLPNGMMVPMDSLSIAAFEIFSPDVMTFVDHYLFAQIESNNIVQKVKVHQLKYWPRNLYISGFHPHIGPMFIHFVLQVKLPNGLSYIIDPTARGWYYKGQGGTLIVHGSLEEYKAGFPATVGAMHDESNNKLLLYDANYRANGGTYKLGTLLSHNLIIYLHRRTCAYCGQIEGEHPTLGVEKVGATPVFEDIDFIHCSSCNNAKYCGLLCKKLDWAYHKKSCGQ